MKVVGERFGKRVITEVINSTKCRVRCDCGREYEVFSASLSSHPSCRWCARPSSYRKKGNKYEIKEDFCEIHFDNGLVGCLDISDLPTVQKYTWCTLQIDTCFYMRSSVRSERHGPSKAVSMHRLILDAKDKDLIDHVNGNGLDNRRANLRFATHAENMQNRRKISKNTTSQYKGVHFRKADGRWGARIQENNKSRNLGTFDQELDAALAYDTAAKEIHGEFASLNFPCTAEI